MKRSEINFAIHSIEALADKHRFALPPFCAFTPDEWYTYGSEYDEIRECMLGFDVTDYGQGHFLSMGLTLITIRNGNAKKSAYQKSYAEKLIMSEENQIAPMHFHHKKMEDIINRGGGVLNMRLYNSNSDGEFADSDVLLLSDGVYHYVSAGATIQLIRGQSVTLMPGVYHEFWAERGSGPVLIGEVSQVNDDQSDNRFHESLARFSKIEEDEPPYRLLCNEYPEAMIR